MVIGERYYCIKDRWHDFDDIYSTIVNRCGCFYEVTAMDIRNNNAVWMSNETGIDKFYYVIMNNDRSYYFNNYFINMAECRRLKLKRIKNNTFMKYLRLFEHTEFKIDDQVVLLYADKSNYEEGFREGQIYTISKKDFSFYPYRIEYRNIDNFIYITWVKREQIKLATQEDIDAIKYNL